MDPLTPKQWKKYNKASRCHICFKQFGDSKKGPKVRDHCYYTGGYRGPALRNCNIMYRIPSCIPVVFHNLLGYDAHLFIRELGRHSRDTMGLHSNPKACLKKTGVRLELLTDPDMLLMFERRIRGGITQAVHRYASANNKYIGDLYDSNKESSYLQYLDANNLYGWAMLQPLSTSKFKLFEIDPDQISDLAARKIKGYLLEVDVRYPTDLHDSHNDLSFMCDKMKINKVEKLVPNLKDKKNYMIHIRVLDQALRHGLVLEMIHRAIEFNQTDWMKQYIDFNTKRRTAATNDFEKISLN